MARFQEIFNNLVVKTLEQSYQFASEFIPKLVFAIVILLIGWICAAFIRKIVSKLLKAAGFDVVSEKTGLNNFLLKGGCKKGPSAIISLIFYWLIMFSTLVMVFNTLNLEAASQLLEKAVMYMPKIIVALILLALGISLGQFIGKFVATTSKLANIPMNEALGKTASYAIIGLSIMMALEQLDVASTIVTHSFIIMFGVFPLVMSLLLIIGGRDILADVVAGGFIKKNYKKGDFIEIEGAKGKLDSVDLVTSRILDGNQEIILPNSVLMKKVVKRQKT